MNKLNKLIILGLAFSLTLTFTDASADEPDDIVSEISIEDNTEPWVLFLDLDNEIRYASADLRSVKERASDMWDRIFEVSKREELREQLREERLMPSAPAEDVSIAAQFLSGPNPSDYAFRMTQLLLGSPATKVLSLLRDDVQDPKDDYATGITYMVHLMCYIAMVFAGIFLIYTIFSSVMGALKTGNFSPVGENDNAIVTLRSGVGAVGIIPLPDYGGLSLSQVVVLGAFLMGIGAGSAIMTKMAGNLMANPLVAASIPSGDVHKLAQGVINMQICGFTQHSLSQTTPAPHSATLLRQESSKLRVEPFVHVGNLNRLFNSDKRVSFSFNSRDPATCGRIETIFPAGLITEDGSLDFERDQNVGLFGSWGRDPALAVMDNDEWVSEFFHHMLAERIMHVDGPLAQLWFDLEPLSKLAVSRGMYSAEHAALMGGDYREKDLKIKDILDIAPMTYWHAIDRYQMGVNAEITNVANSREMQNIVDGMANLVEKHGMIFGGAYYYLIQRQQNAIAQAVESSTPRVRAIDLDRLANSHWFADQYRALMRSLRRMAGVSNVDASDQLVYARNFIDNVINDSHVLSSQPSESLRSFNRATSADGALGNALGAISENLAERLRAIPRLGENTSRLNPDPLLEIQSMGTKIFQAAAAIMVYEDLTGESVLNASSEDGKSPLEYVIIAAIMGFLGAIAFLYASLIPSLPLVMFSISALGLFIYLLQALVAAPIWWALHTHPRADPMLGGSAAGWKMLAGLYLRPALMVMGLLASMALIRLFGGFINEMFGPSARIMSDGFTGAGLLNQLVLYGIMMLVVTYKTFALIYELQQSVLSWIGVSEAYTDFGESQAQMQVVGLGAAAQQLATKR